MKVRVQWLEGRAFVGESGSGHAVVMDGSAEVGGRNIGFRPMEMLLLGMGGCTLFDIVMILEKAREKITHCEVSIEAERAQEDPKIFTQIKMIYHIIGQQVKPAVVERAVKLSAEKYCSASIMLGKSAEIHHEWIIKEG